MKYSYTIVFIILIFNQILLIFASDNELKDLHKLSRNKRQTFKGLNSFIKRNDYNENNDSELDEQNLNTNNNGNNQKKFVSWAGKRNDNQKQQQNNQHNLNTYLPDNPLAAKRFRSWGGKRSEKPFRTWGGKRSSDDLELKLNDYLKRLELLNFLINDLDSQNYD